MWFILAFAAAIIAGAFGLYSGPRESRFYMVCCLVFIAVCAVLSHYTIYKSGEPGWSASGVVALPGQAGMLAIFAALGLVGPALFSNRTAAAATSIVLVAAFAFTGIPAMAAACYLFGVCV